MLGVLIDYDQKHNTQLEETLYQYLKFDSNQKAMAESLYMHRNTINYRLNKIKELTECQLDSFEEKMPYMLAFYIKEIVGKKRRNSGKLLASFLFDKSLANKNESANFLVNVGHLYVIINDIKGR